MKAELKKARERRDSLAVILRGRLLSLRV